jgi:uncharacterized protein YndB with AHSA1/START domain
VTDRLELQFHLSCPPDRAFRAFTEKVDLWWPKGHRSRPDARMDFEPGDRGRLVERSAGGERTIGDVRSWQPPGRLAFDWRLGTTGHPTRVEISFAPTDSGTEVTVLHTPGEAAADGIWPTRVARFEQGWTATLSALADFIPSQKDLA